MIYKRAVRYLEEAPEKPDRETPTRMLALCKALGQIHTGSRYLFLCNTVAGHAAGVYLAAILRAAGYRVAHIAAWHAEQERERFSFDGEPLRAEELRQYVEEVHRVAQKLLAEQPSLGTFSRPELELATGLLGSRCRSSEIVLIESDSDRKAPAFVCAPFDLCILPTIGDSGEAATRQIRASAEAVREGTREVIGGIRGGEAYALLSDACASISARLTVPATAEYFARVQTVTETDFDYRGKQGYHVQGGSPLAAWAALLAMEGSFSLRRDGVRVPGTAIYAGLSTVRIPFLCELLSAAPCILLDLATDDDMMYAPAEVIARYRVNKGKLYVCVPPSVTVLPHRFRDATLLSTSNVTEIAALLPTLQSEDTLLCCGDAAYLVAVRKKLTAILERRPSTRKIY